MTTRLRLQRLAISGFRSIGWPSQDRGEEAPERPYSVDLCDLPDVAVLVGPNGLGKSTVISALRLGLTGRIPGRDRPELPFESIRSRHAMQPGLPSRVHIAFSDQASGEQILRTWSATTAKDAEAQKRLVAEWVKNLAADPSLDGRDVVARLQVTHLLSQGFGVRLCDGVDGGKAAKTLLDEAVGDTHLVQRLGLLRGNSGAVIAVLRKRQSVASAAAASAAKALTDWNELVAQWTDDHARGQAVTAAELDAKYAEMVPVLERLGIKPGPDWSLKRGTNALTAGLAEFDKAVEQRAAHLQILSLEVERSAKLDVAISTLAAEAATANDAAKDARAALEDARRRDAIVVAAAKEREVDGLERRLSSSQATIDSIDVGLRWWAVDSLQLQAQQLVTDTKSSGLQLDHARRELKEATASLRAAKEAAENTATEVTALKAARKKEEERLSGLQAALNEVRRAAIADAPDDGSKPTCPACSAPHDTQKDLLERITENLAALGGDRLTEFDRAIAAAETREGETSDRFTAAGDRLNRAQGAVGTEVNHASAVGLRLKELRRVVSDVLTDHRPGAEPSAAELLADIEQEKATLVAPKLDAQSLKNERARTEMARSALQADLKTTRDELATLREEAGVDLSNDDSLPMTTEESAARLRAAVQAGVLAERAVTKTKAAHDDAEGEIKAATATIQTAWSGMGGEGQPPRSPGDVRIAGIASELEADREWSAQVERMVEGATVLAKLASTAQQAAIERTRLVQEARKLLPEQQFDEPTGAEEMGRFVESVRGRLLKLREEADREDIAAQHRVKRCSDAASAAHKAQQDRARKMVKAVSSPLRKFVRLLMPNAPFESVQAKFVYGRLVQELSLDGRSAEVPEHALDPTMTLSEGELTGLALSYLFAFNSVFGDWCRWGGLVLDDPFQAVDVVRINTLFDILGGMVRETQRQLILTTHDMERAEWARRRLENQGASVQLYELYRSPDGVAVRAPSLGAFAAPVRSKSSGVAAHGSDTEAKRQNVREQASTQPLDEGGRESPAERSPTFGTEE